MFYFTHQVSLWLENTSLRFSAIHLMKTSSDVISKSKNQHHICVLCIRCLMKTIFFSLSLVLKCLMEIEFLIHCFKNIIKLFEKSCQMRFLCTSWTSQQLQVHLHCAEIMHKTISNIAEIPLISSWKHLKHYVVVRTLIKI